MSTTAGWSIAARRDAIFEILQVLIDSGLSRRDAQEVIARRTNFQINTIQGWFSEEKKGAPLTRKPPEWAILDVLRIEVGLITPVPLIPALKIARAAQAPESPQSLPPSAPAAAKPRPRPVPPLRSAKG
ncbi:hypothetical protein [Hydrocarboniphaga sp.]|uniref:hypothetical protein n=1 Tax=Hydrocarboniphaga sp. TaxID=2033016 RepID=UPI00260E63C8|nr:hypothetical protein [Hydrocarboniphaga sp.]